MFNLFKKKRKSSKFVYQMHGPSATETFKMCGNTLSMLWEEFIKGQNKSVDIFEQYQRFINKLNNSYSDIDFDRTIYRLHNDECSVSLTSGECMYLKMLELRKDCYIAHGNPNSPVLHLTYELYNQAISSLSERELNYSYELKKWIDANVLSPVIDVSNRRYGVNICKSSLPYNSKNLIQYHIYISSENYEANDPSYKKWNRISNSPIFNYSNSRENPLIPINIQFISLFILDYLCYATISLPTLDMDRVLNYKDSDSGESVKSSLINAHGEGIDTYLERAITDMNCETFRASVRTGMKIK